MPLAPATENRLRLTNQACNFSVEKGNFEGDFAVVKERKFESEFEEHTVRIQVQRI